MVTQAQLYDREAGLCQNGATFSFILDYNDENDIEALRLHLTTLPSDLADFRCWQYNRLMDVSKIDTTIIQEWVEACNRLHEPVAQSIAPLLSASEPPWLYLIDLERQ